MIEAPENLPSSQPDESALPEKASDSGLFAGQQVIVDLSMGSNMGDRLLNLREGLAYLGRDPQIQLLSVSSVYETEPVGYLEQADFLNIAVRLQTTLPPLDLLQLCLRIEALFLRERLAQWGPRTLDIDILRYDDLQVDTPELTLPHPRMHEREFVLIPLREIETGIVQGSQTVRPVYYHWYDISADQA